MLVFSFTEKKLEEQLLHHGFCFVVGLLGFFLIMRTLHLL